MPLLYQTKLTIVLWYKLPLQETWFRSLDQEDPLEEEIANHSSILAWEIPRLQRSLLGYSPWGHQRVRHDLVTKQQHQPEKYLGFPCPVVKNPPYSARDTSSILGLGRSPGGGNENTLQYCCMKNPLDRGGWWAAVHGVPKSWT